MPVESIRGSTKVVNDLDKFSLFYDRLMKGYWMIKNCSRRAEFIATNNKVQRNIEDATYLKCIKTLM